MYARLYFFYPSLWSSEPNSGDFCFTSTRSDRKDSLERLSFSFVNMAGRSSIWFEVAGCGFPIRRVGKQKPKLTLASRDVPKWAAHWLPLTWVGLLDPRKGK